MKTIRPRALRNLVALVSISVLTLLASIWFHPFGRAAAWIHHNNNWMLDELFTLVAVLMVGMTIYSWRRWRELAEEIRHREGSQDHHRASAVALESRRTEALALGDIQRICGVCQRVQDASDSWITLERYIEARSDAKVSHGLCPYCTRKVYGGHTIIPPANGIQAGRLRRSR